MTIWYDVSDIADWRLCHLTGIQRVVAGVLAGLVAARIHVRLVKFDHRKMSFAPVSMEELPLAARRFVDEIGQWEGDAGPDACSSEPYSSQRSFGVAEARRSFRDTVLGRKSDAAALRAAMREFDRASRRLRQAFGAWARARVREMRGRPPKRSVPLHAHSLHRKRDQPRGAFSCGPIASGDVLVSLGGNWDIPLHSDAVKYLREQGVQNVRMIYDLIPTLKPHWVDDPKAGQQRSRVHTEWSRAVLSESDLVLAISEFTRAEIERYCRACGLASAPVAVVRLGDQRPPRLPDPVPLPRFVPRRGFFLCVCTIDLRKNHRLLYDAWTLLANRDPSGCPDLLCVGTPHLFVDELMREITTDRQVNAHIHFLRDIPDIELEWYYRHCLATIYPSRYEGWGLPVGESLARGRLVLSSNAASMPEISRDLPCFFDPMDVHGVVNLLERVIKEPDWVREREAMIREKFVPTSWTHTALQVMQGVADAGRAL